ncbi:5' nucleotidase, NT5C type [Clostridiisalibacter paucivorans]|uniref:5' nucleotidase, NT5C type n=1 Tax=Clostridiisalibacter paucivorans TaxID=408753 RepID=UPI00047AE468|nr:nucleotidase [Clostridiisalibacter paucivorans]
MNKLNICVDIDGTITAPYTWVEDANKYFKTKITEKDVTKYEIHEVLGVSRESYLEFYQRHGEKLHLEASPRIYAKYGLDTINIMHNLYYVTARQKNMENVTRKWFIKENLPKGELFLLGSHYKVEKAKELNCDIFIEDRYENAIQLATAGFEVLLMDCRYNRMPVIPGITRVFNWQEVIMEIDRYQKEKIIKQTA